MGYPLLLGQLLWHMVPLLHVSGDTTEKILTSGNISAAENSNITLQCHLSLTDAIVSQVNWNQCNKVMLAVYLNKDKAVVQSAFTEKVSLAAEYGITIHFLGVNDTGDYCCQFHTFPYGIYEGRIFLKVKEAPAETPLWKNLPYIITSVILGVLLIVCFTVWILRSKKQIQKIHVPPHVLQKAPSSCSIGQDCNASNPTAGSSAQARVASSSSASAHEESDDGHDYFNVLRYKSQHSISTVV
ncbi:T-cell immunoreceptor with Ig and ITIM domains isoform X2 [Emydura macquarii macquarii]|uniref:T-cell immunoreceptor with Ig and ITIM domains isoform X2 n=1 Tax=Emydura macquarii macquarii TaxID=1129001 RepID=UPI00352A0F13